MSAYVPGIFADIQAIIKPVWPEVVANGIWEATHVNQVPWGELTIPFAVTHIKRFERSSLLVPDVLGYMVSADVYYIAQTAGPISPIIAKLESLRDALSTAALTHGQVYDIGNFEWDDSLGPNAFFVASNSTARAGMITVQVLIGQNITP